MRVPRKFASDSLPSTSGYSAVTGVQGSAVDLGLDDLGRSVGALGKDIAAVAERRLRADGKTIAVEEFTRLQEETSHDYNTGRERTVTQQAEDGNLDVIVDWNSALSDDGSESPHAHSGKSFVGFMMGGFDDRAKAVLERVTNPFAKQELQERIAYYRASVFERATVTEAEAVRQARVETLTQAGHRAGLTVLDAPEEFTDNREMLADAIGSANLGVMAEEVVNNVSNELAVAAGEGEIARDPQNALAVMDDPKTPWIPWLTADQLSALRAKATREIKTRVTLERQEVSYLRQAHIESVLRTGKGLPGFAKRYAQAYADEPANVENFNREAAVASQTFRVMEDMRGLPISDYAATVERLRPASGDPEFDTKWDMYQAVQTQAQQEVREAYSDPAAYVRDVRRDDFERPEKYGLDKDSPHDMAKLSLMLQEQKGIPSQFRRILSDAERKALITQIETAPPEQVLGLLEGLSQGYEADTTDGRGYVQKIFTELTTGENKLPYMYALLMDNLHEPVAHDLVKAMQMGDRLNAALPDETDRNLLRANVATELAEYAFNSTLGNPDRTARIGELQNAAYQLSLSYIADGGGSVDTSDAARRAVQRLVLDRLADWTSPVIVPKRILDGNGKEITADANAIHHGFTILKGRLVRGEMDWGKSQTFRNIPPMVSDAHRDRIIGQALTQGFWQTDETGDGAYYMVPMLNGRPIPLLDAKGERLRIPLAQAMQTRPNESEIITPSPEDDFVDEYMRSRFGG